MSSNAEAALKRRPERPRQAAKGTACLHLVIARQTGDLKLRLNESKRFTQGLVMHVEKLEHRRAGPQHLKKEESQALRENKGQQQAQKNTRSAGDAMVRIELIDVIG
jgi:hypothetical protein